MILNPQLVPVLDNPTSEEFPLKKHVRTDLGGQIFTRAGWAPTYLKILSFDDARFMKLKIETIVLEASNRYLGNQ